MDIGLCYASRPTRWPKWDWIASALSRLGHRVFKFEEVEGLRKYDEFCDLILFEHFWPGRCHPNTMEEVHKRKNALWIQWWFDPLLAYRDDAVIESMKRASGLMDLVLVKEHDLVGEYRDKGFNAMYFDQGCPAEMPSIQYVDKPAFDVCVFGQCTRDIYRQRRADVDLLVRSGLKVCWASDDGCNIPGVEHFPWMEPMQLPKFMGMAAVTLCVDLMHDVPGFWSDRLWLALGAGACVVKRYTKFQPPLPYYSYFHSDSLVPLVKTMSDPTFKWERQNTGKRAREKVMKEYTYDQRLQEIIDYGQNLRGKGSASRNEERQMQGV